MAERDLPAHSSVKASLLIDGFVVSRHSSLSTNSASLGIVIFDTASFLPSPGENSNA